MRILRMIWAGLLGYMVDNILTYLVAVPVIQQFELKPDYINFQDPKYLLGSLVLPMLATVIGGAVAGRLAPDDPGPAGALVGGIGILTLLDVPTTAWESREVLQVAAVAQSVATGLGILAAILVARLIRRRELL